MSAKIIVATALLALSVNLVAPYPYTITDLLASPSEVKEFAKGGGEEFDAASRSSQGEKGAKAYAAHHQAEKGAKGHHDKENQQKQYAEEGGNKKGHNHQDGYYAQQHQAHQGKEGYHFVDKGSYAKGHNTKGHHNVHKLNEYKKNTDFYDEDHDEAFKEKHGGFEVKKGASSGASKKGGYANGGHQAGAFGVFGKFDKGAHNFQDAGHKKAQGQEGHYENGAEFAKKGGQEGFKKWGFSEGH